MRVIIHSWLTRRELSNYSIVDKIEDGLGDNGQGNNFCIINDQTGILTTTNGAFKVNLNPLTLGEKLNDMDNVKNDKEDIYKTENYLFIRSQETVKVYNINDLSFNKQIGTEIKTGFALTKDGMLWAANSNKLVKINPNSLESEEIQLPNNLKIFIDTTYKPSGLCASITENALYFAHAPNFNGTDIYKFDITTQNVNKFFTAPTNYSTSYSLE